MSDTQQRIKEQAYTAAYQDDEIDLFELWNGLVEEKKTIFISFFVVLILAITYLFVVTPVYKATAYLLPPLEKDIQEMNSLSLLVNNFSSSSMNVYGSKDVFDQYLINLSSRGLKKEIFSKYELYKVYAPKLDTVAGEKQKALLNKALETFSKDFFITRPKQNDKGDEEVTVSITAKQSPEKVAQMVNEAIEIAKRNTVNQIYNSILSEYNVRVAQLNDKIESLRKTAKDRRLDRIAKLDEAIEIAKTMKIMDPKSIGQSVTVNTDNVSDSQSMPLYFLGYKSLTAEKQILEQRKNDDPFINGLRSYQEQLAQLKALNIDKKAFGVVRIDQEAFPVDKPAKPKKALILAVAGVLGIMLGVMIALVRRAYRNRQKQLNSVSELS